MSSEPAVVVASEPKSMGVWSLVCGLLAVAGVLMIGQASWSWTPSFDPPGWLRIVTGWMFPLGAVAAGILGGLSVSRQSGRHLGLAGIGLAVVSIGTFIAMLVTHPY